MRTPPRPAASCGKGRAYASHAHVQSRRVAFACAGHCAVLSFDCYEEMSCCCPQWSRNDTIIVAANYRTCCCTLSHVWAPYRRDSAIGIICHCRLSGRRSQVQPRGSQHRPMLGSRCLPVCVLLSERVGTPGCDLSLRACACQQSPVALHAPMVASAPCARLTSKCRVCANLH